MAVLNELTNDFCPCAACNVALRAGRTRRSHLDGVVSPSELGWFRESVCVHRPVAVPARSGRRQPHTLIALLGGTAQRVRERAPLRDVGSEGEILDWLNCRLQPHRGNECGNWMADRHSKHRRGCTEILEQRALRPFVIRIGRQRSGLWLVGITDAHTHVEHLVSDECVAVHRHVGYYLALCGATVLAASLTDPGRGWCRACTR